MNTDTDTDMKNKDRLKLITILCGMIILMIMGVFIAYFGPLFPGQEKHTSYPFVLDDFTSIAQNPAVKDPKNATLVPQISSPRDWLNRPLTTQSFAINYNSHRLNTRGYRIANIAIHMCNSLLLFGLLWRLLRLRGDDIWPSLYFAFAVAWCWAIHPICTQAVTYIVQRGEAAAATGVLAGGLCLTISIEMKSLISRWLFFFLSFFCFIIGMGFKQTAGMFPILAFLIFVFAQQSPWALCKQHKFKMAGGFLLIITLLFFQAQQMGLLTYAQPNENVNISAGFGAEINFIQYWTYQPKVILHYMGLIIFPLSLSLDYGWKSLEAGILETVCTMALLVLICIALVGLRFQKYKFTSLSFLAAMLYLAPTSIVPVWDICVEHRMYLPAAGIIIVLACTLEGLIKRLSSRPQKEQQAITVIFLLLVSLSLGLRTFRRNLDYRSNIILWEKSLVTEIGHVRENSRGWNNLGRLYSYDQKHDLAEDAYRKAIRYLNPAWPIDKRVAPVAYTNLGITLSIQKRFQEAIDVLSFTTESWPDHSEAFNSIGQAYAFNQNYDEALTNFQKAAELDPKNIKYQFDLGQIHLKTRNFDKAIKSLKKARDLAPKNISLKVKIAEAYLADRQGEKAISILDDLLRQNPEDKRLLQTKERMRQKISGKKTK